MILLFRGATFFASVRLVGLLALPVLGCPQIARAQVPFDVLHAFNDPGEGGGPSALLQATDGNFYGTTQIFGLGAGDPCCGTVFRMTADGALTVLHAFVGGEIDGKEPSAGLIQASDGNFYGATPYGGAFGHGTVFKMTPDGVLTILHHFAGGSDGAAPWAALVQANDGSLYGTTSVGGAFGLGTVFKMALTGTISILHHFAGGNRDGAYGGSLVQATDGNFYGVGGSSGVGFCVGTVFKMTPDGTVTVLHLFETFDGDYSCGGLSELMQAADGNLYGTVLSHVKVFPARSAIYRITREGVFTELHVFTYSEGIWPIGRLVQATDGNFYGVTRGSGAGLIFKMTPNGVLTILHTFASSGNGGADPWAGLIQAADGHLYGVTGAGGLFGAGVIFRLRVFPDGPQGLTVTAAGPGRIQLAWIAAAGATSYTVKRGLMSGGETVVARGITTTSFTDTAVTPGVLYYYVVTAANANGDSVSSNQQAVPWGTVASQTPTNMTVGDYDGDGRADVTVYRSSTGWWFTQHSSDGTLSQRGWGAPALGDRPVPADYDGDGRSDVAVYRQTTGQWFIQRSSDLTLAQLAWGAPVYGDLPVPADYDGDGKADLAVYRPSTGEWFIRRSTDGGLTYIPWGAAQIDIPVPGDYDGDGKVDIAVYRGTTGEWFVRRSGDGGLTYQPWGAPSLADLPVPADYDGDGKTDIAVYRGATGEWFVLLSTTNLLRHLWWGAPTLTDIPVAADYDGDGRADVAVYRFLTGEWFVLRSSDGGLTHLGWGAPVVGDAVREF